MKAPRAAVHSHFAPANLGGPVRPTLPRPNVAGKLEVRSVTVGNLPIWATYDPQDGDVYVPNYNSNTVSILNGTSVVGTVPVGYNPYSGTYDSKTGDMYILNMNSNNVSILRGTSVVGSVAVGSGPQYAAFDPSNGYVYVANLYSSTVTVLNGTKYVATISVGAYPYNATYDPTWGYVYIPNNGDGTVSVINGTKVIATLNVGNSPWSSLYDPHNGWEYVPNQGSNNVSILNGTKLVGSVNVGTGPLYAGYDPATQEVYQTNSNSNNVTVLNGTKAVATIAVGFGPICATYNPTDGYMYVPNNGNANVTVLNGTSIVTNLGGGSYSQNAVYDDADGQVYVPNEGSNNVSVYGDLYGVTFSESGLPAGTSWSVQLASGPANSSSTPAIGFTTTNGIYTFSVSSRDQTYASPGGSFGVNSGPATVSIVFSRITFPVNFTESGLPPGTNWSVTFASVTHSSSAASPTQISFRSPNGTIPYTLGVVPGYTTSTFSGTVSVNGAPQLVTIVWNRTTYLVTFTETGLPTGSGWWINVTGGPSVYSVGGSAAFQKPNGSYTFSIGSDDKSFSSPRGAFPVSGSSVNVTVPFTLVRYLLSFVESGLTKGTRWTITVAGSILGSTTAWNNATLPNGTYPYTLFPIAGWTLLSYTGSATVHGKTPPTRIVWTQLTYTVTFSETGLPAGQPWSVNFSGVLKQATGAIAFGGIPDGSYGYSVGAVPGYSPTPSTGNLSVSGQDVPEGVIFSAVSQPVSSSNGTGSSFLGLPGAEGYALLGIIVVAIAAVVGVLLLRRRGATPPPEYEAPTEELPAEEPPTEEPPVEPE